MLSLKKIFKVLYEKPSIFFNLYQSLKAIKIFIEPWCFLQFRHLPPKRLWRNPGGRAWRKQRRDEKHSNTIPGVSSKRRRIRRTEEIFGFQSAPINGRITALITAQNRMAGKFNYFSGKYCFIRWGRIDNWQWLGGDFFKISGSFLIENFNAPPYVLQAWNNCQKSCPPDQKIHQKRQRRRILRKKSINNCAKLESRS